MDPIRPARKSRSTSATYAAGVALTFGLFAIWGLGHKLYDMLMVPFERVFGLDSIKLVITQGLYSLGHMLWALPAALCARRFGYKATILLGLGCIAVGSFVLYPASVTQDYPYFLIAAILMSCGWATLEIAATPLVAAFGSEATAIRRLNLAQTFYVPGALAGWMVGHWLMVTKLALPTAHYAYSIVHPYVAIAVLLVLVAFTYDAAPLPPVATRSVRKGLHEDFRRLANNRIFKLGVAAQFFCAVALGGSWSYSDSFFLDRLPWLRLEAFGGPVALILVVFGLGRIAATALMYRFAPEHVLAVFGTCGALIMAAATVAGGPPAAIGIIAASFFLSVTWPTVIGIAIRGQGPLMKLGTGLLYIAAAIGGTSYRWLAASHPAFTDRYGTGIACLSYGVMITYALYAFTAYRQTQPAEDSAFGAR